AARPTAVPAAAALRGLAAAPLIVAVVARLARALLPRLRVAIELRAIAGGLLPRGGTIAAATTRRLLARPGAAAPRLRPATPLVPRLPAVVALLVDVAVAPRVDVVTLRPDEALAILGVPALVAAASRSLC